MRYPRLQKRQEQVIGCSTFGGLERRPGARLGLWYDENNLSAEKSPTMSVRKARGTAASVDGNEIAAKIIAMCGGDHMILLDEYGILWCSGHSLDINLSNEVGVQWNIYHDPTNGGFEISFNGKQTGDVPMVTDSTVTGLGPLTLSADRRRVTFRVKDEFSLPNYSHIVRFETDAGGSWAECNLADYGITLTGPSVIHYLGRGWCFYVDLGPICAYEKEVKIVRMGANAIVGNRVWVNVVKLASGAAMVPGTDFGYLGASMRSILGEHITMTLCDVDGNDYSGVTVSATEPQTPSGYWLDTSNGGKTLREWSVSSSVWVTVSSTFVKVGPLEHRGVYSTIKKGDAVELSLDSGGDEASALLSGTHYLYNLIDDGQDLYAVISGILSSASLSDNGTLYLTRSVPEMDFVVAAENRLWGCRYSEADGINEIYASKLGDPTNWEVYQGLSTDSWRASRGKAAPFTGGAVLNGHPIFFREESAEKVYPSGTGAHQIQTFDLEGVEQGSADSLVVIEDALFYKSRQGVMVYTGTLPRRISEGFGDLRFSAGTAARHRRKYCISMVNAEGMRQCAVYDLETGAWHLEDEAWEGLAVTWEDGLYYVRNGEIRAMDGGNGSKDISWWAETGNQGLQISTYRGATILSEHKWISRIRLRYAMELDAKARVLICYDDGPWLLAKSLRGNRLGSAECEIFPRRCDHFRLRMEGTGGFQLWSVTMRMERGD